MEKLELKFSYEKEAHSSRDIAVGTLYVMKEALGEPAPQRLRVTIEEDTNGN